LQKNKIAVIGLKGLPAFGGAAAVGENIIEHLKDKYNFTVYSISSHTQLRTGTVNGYNQIVFKEIPFKRLNTLYYYFLSAFHALFAKYDLVHLHHRDAAFIIPLLRIKYKVVLTTHGMVLTKKWINYKWFFELQDKCFLRFANKISCVSKKDKEVVKKILPKKRVQYIPNGVKIPVLKETEKNCDICFAAGRIVPDKGCHTLLEALKKLEFKGKVIIIGDFNQIATYKKHLLELSQNLLDVEFKGLVKEKEKLFSYIGKSKLFVYPSVIESMSMMLLEAASVKSPIICSDIKENRDVFSEEEVTYFEQNNVQALSDKIDWALKNEKIIQNKAEQAYQKLQAQHNWVEISKQYAQLYLELI